AMRHATMVPLTADVYAGSAEEPDHWMNVHPWPLQLGWFCSVALLVVVRVAGPSTTVPAGWAARWSACAPRSDGSASSGASAATTGRHERAMTQGYAGVAQGASTVDARFDAAEPDGLGKLRSCDSSCAE